MKRKLLNLSTIVFISAFSFILLTFQFDTYAEDLSSVPTGENVQTAEPVLDESLNKEVEDSVLYDPNEYLLFHSEICPHCKTVIAYLKKNDVIDGVKLMEVPSSADDSRNEVWENKELMTEISQLLNIPEDQIGSVPLFVHGEDYRMGSTEIIDYVEAEFEIEEKEGIHPAIIVLLSVVGILVLFFLMYKVALS